MNSDQEYVISGDMNAPLLSEGSLSYPRDAPRKNRCEQPEPCILATISVLLSLTGYCIILRTLGFL